LAVDGLGQGEVLAVKLLPVAFGGVVGDGLLADEFGERAQ
jgi:hypothetical protein